MPRRKHQDCSASAFRPLLDAVNSFHDSDKLKTAGVPAEHRDRLYKRFRELKTDRGRTFHLPSGGFVASLQEGENDLLLVSTSGMNEAEVQLFFDFCTDHLDFIQDDFDESVFLVVAHELPAFLRLKDDYRSRLAALEVLDILGPDYAGHDIRKLIDLYRPVCCFKVPRDNRLHRAKISELGVQVLIGAPQLHSPILDLDSARMIAQLEGRTCCSTENLLQALTASQWRHAFLEVYRCLESLFFFPWVLELKKVSQTSLSLADLQRACQKSLNWNAKERESIRRLFELVETADLKALELSIPLLKKVGRSKGATRGAYGELIYSIRNRLVHHEDRDTRGAMQEVSDQEIRQLTQYLTVFLREFDDKYKSNFV